MMACTFALLLGAFGLNLAGRSGLAAGCLLASLAVGTGLFLWEIYSPEYGFQMPWLQVESVRGVLPAVRT
ncbi:MAG: hypothetical protein U1E23_08950 [Reyranellaceae bacterium]